MPLDPADYQHRAPLRLATAAQVTFVEQLLQRTSLDLIDALRGTKVVRRGIEIADDLSIDEASLVIDWLVEEQESTQELRDNDNDSGWGSGEESAW